MILFRTRFLKYSSIVDAWESIVRVTHFQYHLTVDLAYSGTLLYFYPVGKYFLG